MRRCVWKKPTGSTWKKGLFHMWYVKQYPVGELKGPNGHAAGQATELVAIVEDESGKIVEVYPNNICFEC